MSKIVIVAATRTPMGSFQGSLSGLTAPDLGAVAIQTAVKQANISVNEIDEVIMGCVLPAGVKQALHVKRCVKRAYLIMSVQPRSTKSVVLV